MLHFIFWQIVLEGAQIWWELAPHYFPADCFGGSSDLAGTGSTLFSSGLFLECEDSYTESLCCDSAFAHKKEFSIFKFT
jgi:hypothetical protein